ncbi:1877_t:CDS:1, partial [Racocetra persica]
MNKKDIHSEEESCTDIEIEKYWKRKIAAYKHSYNKWHSAIERKNQYKDNRYKFTEDGVVIE